MAVTVPVPGGMMVCWEPALPQQVGVPSVLIAQVCSPPAAMAVTVPVPGGIVAWPM